MDYGLLVNEVSAGAVKVVEGSIGARPFAGAGPAVELRVNGRRLEGWRSEDGVASPLPMSPVASASALEELRLVPYAAAKLRVTAFPVVAG